MISWSKFKSAAIKNGARILQVLGISLSTADEIMPFGEDSCPLPNMIAIYCKTSNIAEPVVIGYLNKNQVAASGEKRIYSLRPDGTLSFYAWLHNDGTMELGGTADNLTRYTPLAEGLTNQDTLINTELGKIAVAIGALGGTYVPGNITTDISASKIEEVKCL